MERVIEFIGNHWMLSIAFVVVLYLVVQELLDNVFKRFQSMTPIAAVMHMNETETTILDVSQATDHKKEHLENAMNIPLSKLETSLGQLEPFKEKPLLIFCQTGAQSPQACKKLYKLGFHQVINLVGGLKAWDEQHLPTTKSKS